MHQIGAIIDATLLKSNLKNSSEAYRKYCTKLEDSTRILLSQILCNKFISEFEKIIQVLESPHMWPFIVNVHLKINQIGTISLEPSRDQMKIKLTNWIESVLEFMTSGLSICKNKRILRKYAINNGIFLKWIIRQ